ncbi:MAG: outer membrane lipoprotein chaperone LolA [Gammaproteobacteria bacterium]|nr:outer membrane lipoprotein chaperone LolA [Gammaproteobacteria bacterium]
MSSPFCAFYSMRHTALYLIIAVFALPLAGVAAAPAAATDAAAMARVQRYLDSVNTLKAAFRQQLLDETGAVLEESGGTVYVQKPGRFRWDYLTPYEQVIIANGSRLWFYDKDLEQVTVSDFDPAAATTPAALLGGSADVAEQFSVVPAPAAAKLLPGLDWITVAPRAQDSQYQAISLGFAGERLAAMRLADNFGQTTLISFSDEVSGVALDPALFEFTAPPGVDVIEAVAVGGP